MEARHLETDLVGLTLVFQCEAAAEREVAETGSAEVFIAQIRAEPEAAGLIHNSQTESERTPHNLQILPPGGWETSEWASPSAPRTPDNEHEVRGLQDAIRRLLALAPTERATMSEAGRRYVEQTYTWARVLPKIAAALARVTGPTR